MRSLRPHARAPRRIRATRGHRAELHRLATSRHFLAHVAIQRVRTLGNVAVELHHAGEHRQGAVRRHSGVSVAGLPPRLLLHQHRQGDQDTRRPQGQARRRPRIHHDGGGVHARPAAARIWRQAERRRMGPGPCRSRRPQAARGHSPHPGAARHRARRPARARRDRLHDDRQQSARLPPRLPQGAPAISQLCRGREGLLPAHEDLPDHAHGGDPQRHLPPRSVGGVEHVQGALSRQGTRLSSVGGHGLAQGLLGLAAAADRGGKGDPRAGLVSLWDRGEPADDRSIAPVYPRARADRPPRQIGRTVRAEHAARHSAERRPARVESFKTKKIEEETMTIPQLMPWIGGPVKFEAGLSPLVCPIDDTVASQIIESDAKVVDAAVKHAHAAFLKHQDATTSKRVEWLLAAADVIDKIEGELVRSLIRFIGKPRRAATFEAKRVGTFIRACAAQVPHLMGEVLPLDVTAAGAGRFGFTTRVPYGVVAAVTPFNGPANLLIQKVAPALAVGNAVVVKPSPPGTEVALLLAQALKTAGVPDGLFNVVPGGRETAKLLAAHPLVAVVTVTGSTAAGNELARAAGAKKFIGELGSNAANIVCADADLNDAATRIAGAGFEASGQQCISAQRVIVEQKVFDAFLEAFVAAAKKLKVGDPNDPATDVGPMVNRAAADRVEQMIADAVEKGARLVLKPERKGCILGPAILANAPGNARLMSEEAFGPVVVVQPVADVDAALALANSSEFGLQGACFTASLETAFKMSRKLKAGALWINEASRFRLDTYPFGGVGSSGFGREGVRYAMEELSQWKFTGIRLNPQ